MKAMTGFSCSVNLWIPIAIWLAFGAVWMQPLPAHADAVLEEGVSKQSYALAVDHAICRAVETACWRLLPAKLEKRRLENQEQPPCRPCRDFVTSYEVVKKRRQGQLYWANVRVQPNLKQIESRLKQEKILMKRPKIMVIVDETYSGLDFGDSYLVETELIALLRENGFRIVDKTQIEQSKKKDMYLQVLDGNVAAAETLGLFFDTPFVLMGKSLVADNGPAFGMEGFHSIQASLQLRLLNCQSGEVVEAIERQAMAAHTSKLAGAGQAARAAATWIVEKHLIETLLQDRQVVSTHLMVNVTGVVSFEQYDQIVAYINALPDVGACNKKGWTRASGLLVLEVEYAGGSEAIARKLDGKPVGMDRFQVDGVAPGKLNVSLQM